MHLFTSLAGCCGAMVTWRVKVPRIDQSKWLRYHATTSDVNRCIGLNWCITFRLIKLDANAFEPMKSIKWIKLFNNQLKSLDLNLTDSVLETITCLDIHSECINYLLLNQFTGCNLFIKVLSISSYYTFFFNLFR